MYAGREIGVACQRSLRHRHGVKFERIASVNLVVETGFESGIYKVVTEALVVVKRLNHSTVLNHVHTFLSDIVVLHSFLQQAQIDGTTVEHGG